MSRELNAEVRSRIEAHLDAVESVLVAAGHTRAARLAVVDDLEAQILEMLNQSGATPTEADVEAVLGRLDAPAAYGDGGRLTQRRDDATEHINEEAGKGEAAQGSWAGAALGMMALGIALTAGVGELVVVGLAMAGSLPRWAQGFGWLGLGLCVLGVLLGLMGVMTRGRRGMALAGLVFNGMVVVITMGWLLSGHR
jgi:hypothetical protein